jgi:FAD/FMN-containing dehydrogenase
MIKIESIAWLIVLMYIFDIGFTKSIDRDNNKFVRINNNDLEECLSSSIRRVYPCNTLTNQNSSQYQCDHFNVSGLSSVRGGRISHSPAVIVYVKNSIDVQNVVKCATKLNYIVNALSGGHSYEGYGLGSTSNNIIINMESINYININQDDKTGTFGGGARIGPIYYRTYEYDNYTINGGSCAWIGLAANALGGGYGYLVRLHGLLSDQILEMKAVNDQGQYCLTSSEMNIFESLF